jgi:hypothetical protein
MSRTKRNIPLKKLTKKEKELVEKGKYKHAVNIKGEPEEKFSDSAKREAKKEKHRKQRKETIKEIEDQTKDDE